MPSPIGHAIAGTATVWLADLVRGPDRARPPAAGHGVRGWLTGSALAGAALAMTPDLDYLASAHRLQTHSIGAALVVAALVWLVARIRRGPALAAALVAAASYGSHLGLDWLNGDSGLMLFWPLTTTMHAAPVQAFLMPTFAYWDPVRFVLVNSIYVGWEILVIGGPALIIGWLRAGTLARTRRTVRKGPAADTPHLDLRPSLD